MMLKLLRIGLYFDYLSVKEFYDPRKAEPEMLEKDDIMTRLTEHLNKHFTLSDVQDAELLKPRTIQDIEEGKIAAFDFERLVLDPIKIALRKTGRPLAGIKINDQKLKWPEALEKGEVSNLVLKDMVNSQIACSNDVDIEKFPQNFQNGFNRTKRIVNG